MASSKLISAEDVIIMCLQAGHRHGDHYFALSQNCVLLILRTATDRPNRPGSPVLSETPRAPGSRPPAPIDDKSFHPGRAITSTCEGHFRAHFCVVRVLGGRKSSGEFQGRRSVKATPPSSVASARSRA